MGVCLSAFRSRLLQVRTSIVAPARLIMLDRIAPALSIIALGLAWSESARAADPGPEAPTQITAQQPDTGRASPLWMGVRMGLFAPYGAVYSGQDLVTTGFQDVATSGPAGELELGGRLSQHFVVYGFAEYAALGPGQGASLAQLHGAQMSAMTNAVGVGARWLAHPSSVGLALDLGVGYRWFVASWADGTNMRLRGLGDIRLGVGASLAAARGITLQPMFTIYTGVFEDRTLGGQPIGTSGNSYAATLLSLGGTFDLLEGS